MKATSYVLGLALAIAVGMLLYKEYNIAVALAVATIISLLVDIRFWVSR